MTRRDRVMMQCSLEFLRRNGPDDLMRATNSLRYGSPWLKSIQEATFGEHPARPFRARLALLLRAMLRADAGDFGEQRFLCQPCGGERSHESRNGGPWTCMECKTPGSYTWRYAPLWEQAARHEVQR